ncbi:hypothetical protein MD588_10015 [Photobacterium sp. SDRW27]|uniref:tetratricopeptide repeat protein n=1 Tax=Photobacterium obscurum TaxID=2829490 RepID=UPI002244B514|nr:hypothetical protein [Photobacterium obscurum]MCW8329140.1 hypothetical protein [Photobacterium obscurum]
MNNPIKNNQWLEELFLLLGLSDRLPDYYKKYEETLAMLKNEIQYVVSTLSNNEHQLIQESQKRAATYFINGHKMDLSHDLRVSASELLLRHRQPEIALSVLQPLDMEASAAYFINFGRALMQIGVLGQAEQCFINACEKEQDSAEPLFHLAFLSGLQGEVKKAEKYYLASLKKDEKHKGSLLNLSYLYFQLEQFWKAKKYADQLVVISPEQVGAYLILASCNNAQRNFEVSYTVIQQARRLFNQTVSELDELEAIACFELGKYEEVVILVSRFIQSHPMATDLKYIRAKSYIELKSWEQALDDITELLSIEPFDADSLEMRFIVLYAMNKWSEAEVAYVKLVETAPQLRLKYQQQHKTILRNMALIIS